MSNKTESYFRELDQKTGSGAGEPQPRSWAPEVIADSSGKWCGNALRFATKEEAEANVQDLHSRWMLVSQTRVVPSDDPVNYRWVGGKLERVN